MLAKNHSVPCLTIKIENLCAISHELSCATHAVNCNLYSGDTVLHVAHIPLYKFLVKHRPCGTLQEFLLARLDPPSNLHGSRHECWGGLGGMTHARESSLSSLASCSRPSSPPTYPHRLRPRVGQPASLTSRHRAHFGPSARCASMQGSQRPSAVTSAEPLESMPLPPEI